IKNQQLTLLGYKLSILAPPKPVSNKPLGIALRTQTTGGLGGGLRCWHVALAVEEASGVNDEARRENLAEDDTVFFDLQHLGGVDVSFYFPGDADDTGMDFPIYLTLIVNHHRAFGSNLTTETRVDADQAGRDRHLSLNLHARLKPPDPVIGEISEFTPLGLSKAEWHCCLPPGSLVIPVVREI